MQKLILVAILTTASFSPCLMGMHHIKSLVKHTKFNLVNNALVLSKSNIRYYSNDKIRINPFKGAHKKDEVIKRYDKWMQLLSDMGYGYKEKRALTERYLQKADELKIYVFESKYYDPKYTRDDTCDEIVRAWRLRGGGGR